MGQPLTRQFRLPDEPATEALGRALVAAMPDDKAGWQVLLQGELGAGKTTVARAMLRELGHRGTVPSPTYTLVEPYELRSTKVYHVDLYRIADSNELEFLGWSELGDGLLLVEWPERAPGVAEMADLRVALGYSGAGRQAVLSALSTRGSALLDRLSLP